MIENNNKLNDIVISSRVRLARNFKSLPFVHKMNEVQSIESIEQCRTAVSANNVLEKSMEFIDLSALEPLSKKQLVEKHLISPAMLDNKIKRGLFLTRDNFHSIMVNEEDHIRIQTISMGFDLVKCLNEANRLDDVLESSIEYGFDEKFGYLTSCPTNVGTGLRASLMIHLPALFMTNNLPNMIRAIGKLGIAVRGIYGEGSKPQSNMYQISNQVTLGSSEEETVQKLTEIAMEVISKEQAARTLILKNSPYWMEDKVMRALGILKSARILTQAEFMEHISHVRLGINMGIITDVAIEKIVPLTDEVQAAGLMVKYGDMTPAERDVKRAEIVRNTL